jgi:hypothetical protein
MTAFERGLRPRKRILGGGFGRGAKPPSEDLYWARRRDGGGGAETPSSRISRRR